MTDIFASSYIKKLTKHIVKNNSAVFENRDGLQFTGNVTISDDSGNNNTVVNIPTTDLSGYIPNTRKINNKGLSADISLTGSDIGLSNITNDAQVKKITSSVDNNLVSWNGINGDTPKDSGILATNVVTKDDIQTLTQKTLTSPIISTIINTGTITIPTTTGTLALNSNPANINPSATNTYTLGTSALCWKEEYINSIYSASGTPLKLGVNGTTYASVNTTGLTVTTSGYGNALIDTSNIPTGTTRTLKVPNKDGAIALGTIYKGTVTIGDVGGTSGSLPVSGDIISATATNSSGIDIAISHPSLSANAIYNITIENLGSEVLANDITQTVFTRISTSQIRVFFEETSTSSQNVKLNIMIFD